ncbi:flagellin [Synergistaceae bacterium OttesenSCG-928-I11]|nr:flagellin [Synergistaceae bacterium OttesenSCG-928-I11]
MRVKTNISSLHAYNALALTNDKLARSIGRLSTGLHINSAADDAAGLAISEKMRAQIRGTEQAGHNAQDGISMIQTAEGALSETHAILQRVRELSVQAANDTLTAEDRSYIQLEIDQLRLEVDRISTTTQFNKKMLLDGSSSTLWSSSDLETRVIVRDALRGVDQFGQKTSVEGNYNIKIVTDPGASQIQKSNVMEIGEMTKQPPTPLEVSDENTIDLDTGTNVSGATNGTDWQFDTVAGVLTISGDGVFKISGGNANKIVVAGGITANIIFSGVTVDVSTTNLATAFSVGERTRGATVNLFLEGTNTFKSGGDQAGIHLFDASTLNIYDASGNGSLSATGGDNAAGIGGGMEGHGGTVNIYGGSVTATGGMNGAGIGGGLRGDGGETNIYGGSVTATGGTNAAGIGGGDGSGGNGNGGTTTICGGSVTATGGTNAAGIGGGDNGNGGETNIYENADVKAISGGGTAEDIGHGNGKDNSGTTNRLGVYTAPDTSAYAYKPHTLGEMPEFMNASGVRIFTDPQTITLTQGDGKRTSVTLYASDTMDDVAKKISDAIAYGLGQFMYVDDITNFCTISDGTENTSESVYKKEEIKDENGNITGYKIHATMLVRSAVAGSGGDISFAGSEDLLRALGLSTIQQSSENRYTVSVNDAHSGNAVVTSMSTTGSTLHGLFGGAIDVEWDAMANTEAAWNEQTKRYEFKRSTGIYETTIHISDNSCVLQVGANEGEDMTIGFADMSARALGLNRILVTDRESAARAITIVDNAIGLVSRQRAKLGAYQNRLEHTTSNLTTMSTNLTASESRIRDADMAKEMMEFTKLNILSQAGNSMLAQANQLPQNILSLLR